MTAAVAKAIGLTDAGLKEAAVIVAELQPQESKNRRPSNVLHCPYVSADTPMMSAPRLPHAVQMNRSSISDSRISSGQRSPLIVTFAT
jgi:hypothetical protein